MTADELRQEIEQTRQSLGETVDELAAKADVKTRARANGVLVAGAGVVAVWQWKKQA